ncbi:MAG: hypothetical protein ACRERR_07000 [Moraxellaceae bacterium]
MQRVFVYPFLLAALLLAACSHAPSRNIPVSENRPAGRPATSAVTTAPVPADAAPVSPATVSPTHGLSYRPPAQPQPPRQLADGAQLPAVQGLLSAAERAVRSDDLELAAVSLERAQRLAPQSAVVYQRLADVRLRQKRPAEAEQLARKALAYAGQPAQQAQLWRQIAAARQQQGQMQSAHDALQRAITLESAGVLP